MAIDDVEIQFSSKASLEFVVCLFFETLNNGTNSTCEHEA